MHLKDDPLVLLGWSCPYCGNPTKLVEDTQIYGRSYGTKCYVCEPCGAWVGCHKGTDKALGRVANKELRQLKHQAHEAFDPLWKAICHGKRPMRSYQSLFNSLRSKLTSECSMRSCAAR